MDLVKGYIVALVNEQFLTFETLDDYEFTGANYCHMGGFPHGGTYF